MEQFEVQASIYQHASLKKKKKRTLKTETTTIIIIRFNRMTFAVRGEDDGEGRFAKTDAVN